MQGHQARLYSKNFSIYFTLYILLMITDYIVFYRLSVSWLLTLKELRMCWGRIGINKPRDRS